MTELTNKPRRRRRRWWLRLPLILIGFLLALAILTQLVLWTDYPRRIAEAQVTQLLGVRTRIGALRVGWFGHTSIDDVSLTLPMAREPFLTVDHIRATHTSLPLIAFAQDVSDVVVEGVHVDARQEADGRWNLQALIPPSSPTTQPVAAGASKKNPLADLPDLRADDVRVTLTRADGKRLDLPPTSASVKRVDPLLASIEANVGQTVVATGQLGLTAAMPHELRVRLGAIPADVAAFLGMKEPPSIAAELAWRGRRAGDGIDGTLSIDKFAYDVVTATGCVDVEQRGTGVTLRPVTLAAAVADGKTADVKVNAGRILLAGQTVDVDDLRGTLNGGRLAVRGRGDLASRVSTLTSEWEQVRRADLTTTGSLTLETAPTLAGRLSARATVRGDATVAAGHAAGSLVVRGEADALDAFTADVDVEPLAWTPASTATTRPASLVAPALRGKVVGVGRTLQLAAFHLADESHGTLAVFGAYDLDQRSWWATLDAAQLTSPLLAGLGVKPPLDASLVADGTLTRADVRRLYAKLDRATVWAEGSYDFAIPRPLKLDTWAWYEKPETEDSAARLTGLRATGTVEGTVAPRDLTAEADVSGSELVFAGRPVGDVDIHVTATLGDDAATVRSREMQVLGATWTLRGDWSASSGRPPTLVASFHDLPVAALGDVLERDDLAGTIDRGTATFTLRSTRLDQIEGTAAAKGHDLGMGALLHADTLDLTATLAGGKFEVKPVLKEKSGTIDVTAGGDVRLATPVKFAVTLTDWPAPTLTRPAKEQGGVDERFRPTAIGTVTGDYALATQDLNADVKLNGTLARDEAADPLATFDVDATLRRTQVTLRHAAVAALDGTLTASGAADLRNPNGATLDVTLDKLTPSRLAWLNPLVQEVQGTIDGTISLKPAAVERPLAPLQIDVALRPSADTGYRGVAVGDIDVRAFADLSSPRAFRIVTDGATLHLADGTVQPFVRLTRALDGQGWSQLVTADFARLDLAQLAKAADENGKGMDVVGRVGGRVQLFGNAFALDRLSGDATLTIAESDLARFPPISALYDALSVGLAGKEPIGTGSLSLRVGEGVLSIDDASYFNRGVYASAFGPVRGLDRLGQGGAADIDHVVVVGSLQPLRAVKLPFFGDVNDTLAALQSSVTAIEVTGTTRDPKFRQVALGGLGDAARKILLGKAKGDK